MKNLILIITFSLLSSTLFAKEYSSKVLFKYYKDAVVRINVYQQGVFLWHGTGFFIDGEGRIATNYHVAYDGLFVAGNTLEIVTYDKKVYKNYKVGKCFDERKIDLCVIKIDKSPKRWIEPIQRKLDVGEKIYALGHPKGYDWSISEGIISSYRQINSMYANEKAKPIEQVQVSTPISNGNSGGPIISSSGKLVGVSTWIRVDKGSQNLNFGISSNELYQYNKKIKEFKSIAQIRKEEKTRLKAASKRIQKKYTDPIWDVLTHNEKAKKWDKKLPKHIGFVKVEGYDLNYQVPLAGANAKDCKYLTNNEKIKVIDCKVSSVEGYRLEIFPNRGKKDMYQVWNKKSIPNNPLPVIKGFIKNKKWDKMKKNLTAKQIKYLHMFQNKPYKCTKAKKDTFYRSKNQVVCSASFYNFMKANYVALENLVQFQPGGEFISIYGYAKDAYLAGPIYDGSSIASLIITASLKENKVRANRTPASVSNGSMSIGDLVKAEKKNQNSLKSLVTQCNAGSVDACKKYSDALSYEKNKTAATYKDLYYSTKIVCEKGNSGEYCYHSSNYASKVNPKDQVPLLIRACKLNFKKACNVRLPSSN